MKLRLFLMLPLALGATALWAQDTHSTTYNTAQGELTVNWGQPPGKDYGPAPDFAQLAQGQSYISESAAAGYAPLANDFIHADRNRDGRISKAEYDRWAGHR
ncbi:MAG: hypothetical protein J0H15_00475 [Xanthomonadales bacterium]|nr:hypothetical protein [Xanthomonadales bacterium]